MAAAEEFTYLANDGTSLYVNKWTVESVGRPRAVIQIAHGMAEHIKRYDNFARFLVRHGFSVYGNDHRGHGRLAERNGTYGYFSDENGFDKVVDDMLLVTERIQSENPDTPVFLFGHSLGSFLARRYIQLYGEKLSGVILSGTGGDSGVSVKVAKMIARAESRIRGRKAPSPLMTKLTFGAYNKKFKPSLTEYDWLSRDNEEVRKYIEDPLCGSECSAGFFIDLFEGLELINDKKNIRKTPESLPVYIFSGDKDPVGNDTKGIRQVYGAFQEAGLENVELKFYEGGRHEMLNETNREEVHQDILAWLEKHL
ncbi:alpha/beta hydrolase [Evansella sp. LMS18]|uniref:alpha/beta hydrolase n=1 Tax=Evansella sp. LMS18 TaxID=2924033 RepID=UPI0020D0B687|nr:alpha/beta hydrolase [Evansella sp. LMS18]UTR11670.1 alpha/beta hydrolase [Evansella sp. LMS18]